MSDRRPGRERAPGSEPRRGDPPGWLEHEGASVFPTPPSRPSRRPRPAGAAWPPPPSQEPGPPDDPWGPPPAPGRYGAAPGPGPYGDARRPDRTGHDPYPPDTLYAHDTPYPPDTLYAPDDRYGAPDPSGRARRPAAATRRAAPGPDRDRRPGDGFRSPIGLGAVVGIGGAAAFVVALVVLPWFTAADHDVTLGDIRTAYEVSDTDPAGLPGSGGTTDSTLPDGQIPTTDEVAAVVEDQVRDAASVAAAQAIDSGRARYLELYVDTLWLPVAAVVAGAAVVSTLLAPRSAALSLLLGVRRLAGSLVVVAGLVHAAALWIVFTGDGAPSPATGVWLGVAGLAAVLVGCVIGPRR